MNKYASGAIAGLIATIPMTVVMVALFHRLPREQQEPLPPRQITSEILQRAGLEQRLSDTKMTGLALISHFAYGALSGVGYSALPQRIQEKSFTSGGLYGMAVWLVSYLGWIPALKLLPPATQHPKQRNLLMWAAHLVWGSATALVVKTLR